MKTKIRNKTIYLLPVSLLLATPLLAAEEEWPAISFGKLIPIIIGVIFYLISRKKKLFRKMEQKGTNPEKKVKPKTFSTYARDPLDRDKRIQDRLQKQYKPIEPK